MLRRHFIKLSATTIAATMFSKLTYMSPDGDRLLNFPDEVWAEVDQQWMKLKNIGGSLFSFQDISVQLKTKKSAQGVYIESPIVALQSIKLKWNYQSPNVSKILGDHWERSYGDLAWKEPMNNNKNPWYVLVNSGQETACFGTKTGASSICWWSIAKNQIELNLDTRSGGMGVKLGSRILHAADIVTTLSEVNESPYATATRFCGMMCEKPLLPKQPVYGINDWYAVYGNNSAESIRTQTAFMSELVTDTNNRPFSVIDDGWQIADNFAQVNDKFKDMQQVAADIKKLGMRPGLWTRPLIAKQSDPKSFLAPSIPGRTNPKELILDPTIPETLDRVKHNIILYRKWGFELVKHDYSTYDIFGKWGFSMNDAFTQPGWKFYDQGKTNAEIISNLYRTISRAAGPMYIIGCNTISHLSAGLFEINRIGDDTSGKEWARTRKMGVNTLGFRLPQHQTFYAADGDCVGLTKDVPWEKNRQWLQLLAESGSPLFISAQTDALGSPQKAAIKLAFAQAAKVQPTGEPLDWMQNSWPSKWKLNGREVNFDWD